MIHGCVTLDEVFSAASVRAASLVPETSGYLALAVGDATSRLPFAIDDRMVMLTTEGNVGITKRGEVLPPKEAAAGLRSVLTRLLAVSTGTAMPALAGAGRPRDESDRGVDAVVEEIEAALIPVNRAAARRALARLARETIRAKETGKVKSRPSVRPSAEAKKAEVAAPKPAAPPARVEAPRAEAARADIESSRARIEPPRVDVEPARAPVETRAPVAAPPAVAAPRAATPKAPPVVAAPRAPTPRPPPVVALPRVAAAPEPNLAQLAVGATTPPPLDAVTLTSVSMPVVILPTPPPVPVFLSYRDPTPPPPMVETTPTLIGMGAVEIEGPPPEPSLPSPPVCEVAPHEHAADRIVGAPTISVEHDEEADIETVQAPPTRLVEPFVLAQPSESPELAFELDFRAPRPAISEPITPPFALDEVPVRVAKGARVAPVRPFTDRFIPAPDTGSRADQLLARFGASCVDEVRMAEAAACLRNMAGIEGTPPPAPAAESASPEPETRVREAAHRAIDLDSPLPPRARRGSAGKSFGLAIAVLAIGVVGGGALVRMRPDLFGAAPPQRAETTKPAPVAPPAPTVEPQGVLAPGWTPSVGARAERGSADRAR